jgi:hypothetical protein
MARPRRQRGLDGPVVRHPGGGATLMTKAEADALLAEHEHRHAPSPELPLEAAPRTEEKTPMTTKSSTQMVPADKPGAIATTTKPPAFVGEGLTFTLAEWEALPPEEQQAALAFFAEESEETTRGVQVEFPRVKYPTSGSSFWEMRGLDGEPIAVKQIEGVVVYKLPVRAYWPLDQEIGNNPPLCSSLDSVIPVDGPGKQARTCADCKWSQWGSGKDGRGQACKQRLNTFVMLPDAELPTLLSLPPTALRAFGQYAVALRQAKVPLVAVTTIFGLTDAKSSGGIAYKGITLKLGRRLSYPEMTGARVIREAFEAQMAKRGVRVDEAEDTPGEHADDGRTIEGQAERVY